ncbi:SHOCT domain-containing protein [Alicyclobacillus shizuokensis]|uniref:SHOCT domain-containing protein n=1 Tax=Alicyclobacillus shizuokensis TaxID=392014 RepID=UPI000829C38C|nr:SHOCT domain-containing protein [Alicyclobacillus shizuokensis]MCL6625188.1 SHOCT domain-containing protein [Alicyclobacillus shizuokensis]
MWWGHHGFWCFGVLLLILIIVFCIVRVFAFGACGHCRRRWPDDAEAILRRRLANGEIDESEYQKLKDALKK